MDELKRKQHWEAIYQQKKQEEFSWFQEKPESSLHFFKEFELPKHAKIIDIGGGDSFLVDHLLGLGYQDLSVLDLSSTAIERAKKRLGAKAQTVKWIEADAANFSPTEHYDFWHDRAAFHFLTDEQDIKSYINTAQKSINPGGILVIGTFSEQGPKKCSGIDIKQYSEQSLSESFEPYFDKIACQHVEHQTPFNTGQHFIFCSFKRK